MHLKKLTRAIFASILFLLVAQLSSFASSTDSLKINKKTDLVVLCKVWGLLKYHHPEVIKGKFNWDDELIKFLPSYVGANTKKEQNQRMLQWIKGLGAVPSTDPVPDSILLKAKLKPDFSWITKSEISSELGSLLTRISNYHVKEKQHYVNVQGEEGVYFFSFTKEDAYAKMSYPTVDYRLLSVFRYWNMIEYWSPYKDLIKQGWSNLLPSFIAEAVVAKDETAYVRLVQRMAGSIDDSHAVVIAKEAEVLKGSWKMPFTVKFIEGKAVVNSVNQKLSKGLPLEVGDILNAVNGKKVNAIVNESRTFVSASNEAVVKREIAKILTRTKDSVAVVSITNSAGKSKMYTVKNIKYNAIAEVPVFDYPYQKDSAFFRMPKGVLYLNPQLLKATHVAAVNKLINSGVVTGIVVDARLYPKGGSGNLGKILEESILGSKVEFAKFSSAVHGYPGYFSLAEPMTVGKESTSHFKGKVAILVNEQTQSAAEFLAMVYQAVPGAIVVGSTTAGADGNVVATFALPGGIYTTYTGLGVFYPDGRQTQQIGIVPDIRVSQSIEGFRKGKDEILDRAVRELLTLSK